jgi:tripartite ATP-independent transporter DctM subunit
MGWIEALLLLIGTVLALMALGLPVALAFFGANLVGAAVFFGGLSGLELAARNIVEALTKFALGPVAMFILMGEVLFRTGVAVRAIDAVERLITRVPGRLSVAAISGGVVFSTLSGSSMANTALLGSTLMPEMLRRGYHRSMCMGPIMAVGGIAMLIPPSTVAVLLGSIAEIPISYLLIGGIVPGVMIGGAHLGYVLLRCWVSPGLAPPYSVAEMTLWERVRPFLVYVLPVLSLFVLVVGSILGGFATPTESAALGAVGAVLVSACYRSLSLAALHRALMNTGKTTTMMLFIIGASLTFSQILAFSGATNGLVGLIREVDPEPLLVLAAMLAILLFLGAFMDSISMMLLTLPFFIPTAEHFGIDLIWFGILVLLTIEISGMTPPFGLMLFVMKSVAPPDFTMMQVYRAILPFILIELCILGLLVTQPGLVTYLPSLLRPG